MQIRYLAVITSFIVLMSSQVFAQARVVEAGGNSGGSNAAPANANNDLVVSLYNQLESLQQEIQTLRGLVEEQGNQIRRMQTEQRDRYLDIDRRLSEMPTGAPLAGGAPGSTIAVPPVSPPTTAAGNGDSTAGFAAGVPNGTPPAVSSSPPTSASPSSVTQQPAPNVATTSSTATASSRVVGPASGSPQDEQELYRNALKLLVEENKYVEAIQMLQTYIDSYPMGRLLTNALYWQGEAYLAISEFNQAEVMFNRLLNEYPQDPKAAGGYLKLGKVYQGLGDKDKARSVWQELPSRFPDSTNEIVLAREYLQTL